jgi:hypothetical protein
MQSFMSKINPGSDGSQASDGPAWWFKILGKGAGVLGGGGNLKFNRVNCLKCLQCKKYILDCFFYTEFVTSTQAEGSIGKFGFLYS